MNVWHDNVGVTSTNEQNRTHWACILKLLFLFKNIILNTMHMAYNSRRPYILITIYHVYSLPVDEIEKHLDQVEPRYWV